MVVVIQAPADPLEAAARHHGWWLSAVFNAWRQHRLDATARAAYDAEIEPVLNALRSEETKAEALADLMREATELSRIIARAYVGRVIDGGAGLFDLESLFPASGRNPGAALPLQVCDLLLVPSVLSFAVPTCRYCGHPSDDHWGDGCGLCMWTHEACSCTSMYLPADMSRPPTKEGADAPV